MYLTYFGLREQPFGVTPDPRFLYLSAAHKEALASLYYGIEAGRGFLGLIAQPGGSENLATTPGTRGRVQSPCISDDFQGRFLDEDRSESFD